MLTLRSLGGVVSDAPGAGEDESTDGDPLSAPAGDPVSGPAHATPGELATAIPTPNATANAPTRPTYRAYPMIQSSVHQRAFAGGGAPFAARHLSRD